MTELVVNRSSLAEASAKRETYALSARSVATRKSYASSWRYFAAFCQQVGAPALPASAVTIADYVIHLGEQGKARSTVQRHLAAIRAQHMEAGIPTPTVDPKLQVVVAGVLREHSRPVRRVAALMPDDVRVLVGSLPDGLIGIRDRALLTFGLATGLRRGELAALEVDDLRFDGQGVRVTLRRSKTDQLGEGHERRVVRGEHPETCPVRALQAWLDAARITSGRVFRSLDRHGNVHAALSGRSVDYVLRTAVRRAQRDGAQLPEAGYSAHSLRSGLCTAAALAGKPLEQIRAHVGHRSIQTTAIYVRQAAVRSSTLTEGIGL